MNQRKKLNVPVIPVLSSVTVKGDNIHTGSAKGKTGLVDNIRPKAEQVGDMISRMKTATKLYDEKCTGIIGPIIGANFCITVWINLWNGDDQGSAGIIGPIIGVDSRTIVSTNMQNGEDQGSTGIIGSIIGTNSRTIYQRNGDVDTTTVMMQLSTIEVSLIVTTLNGSTKGTGK